MCSVAVILVGFHAVFVHKQRGVGYDALVLSHPRIARERHVKGGNFGL